MEMWELAKRILASANQGQTFTPSLAGGTYRRDLEAGGETGLPTLEEFHNWAELLASNMIAAGLIASASSKPGRLAMLNVMQRTEFGDELYETLQRRDRISVFRATQTTIDAGAIRQLLHQLNA